MRETKKFIETRWDKQFKKFVKITFRKLEREFTEHASLMNWVALRVLLPLIVFYILVGALFFNTWLVGSLFIGALFFIYSNFLPDLDSLIVVTKSKSLASKWFEKYALLFFAPVLVYYAVSGKAKPIYASKPKEFHSVKALLAYVVFLLVLGTLFWADPLRITVLPLFGGLGFLTHLIVNGYFK